MRYTIYSTLLILAIVSCRSTTTITAVADRFEDDIADSKSWVYDAHYKMKYFSSDDTLNYYTNCRLIRDEADTIFGGVVWIKNDSVDRYYDLNNIYIINHNREKITRFFPHQGQDWAIKGNTVSGVLDSYFLRTGRLSSYLSDSTTIATLTDTTISDEPYYAVQFEFADELPVENQSKTFYFDQNGALKDIIYSVEFQREWQYNEWHFTNEKHNDLTPKQLGAEFDSLASIYTIEDYEEPDEKAIMPLATGSKAPDFTGLNYQTNDSIQLVDYKNQVVILDFWYKDCYPCIKAIPFLSRLRDQYEESELAILGLNPFDHKEENRRKLPDFIEINKINYPIVFIDKNVQKDYNVRAFPTFYIIDENGEIAFSKRGYSEEGETTIDSLLNVMVK